MTLKNYFHLFINTKKIEYHSPYKNEQVALIKTISGGMK